MHSKWNIFLIVSILAASTSLGILIGIQSSKAQKKVIKVSQDNTESPQTKKLIGNLRGLEELKSILEASEATGSPKVRKVIINVPANLPEHFRLLEASRTAIREFFLISDRESLDLENLNSSPAPDLESPEGKKAKLTNGGTIALRIKRIKDKKFDRAAAELIIKNHNIVGFEDVTKIEFDTQ
jgi:hypothetical protein